METTRRSSHDEGARSSGKRDAKRWKKTARLRFFFPCLLSAYMEAHERKRVKETSYFVALTTASVEERVQPPPAGSSTQHRRRHFARWHHGKFFDTKVLKRFNLTLQVKSTQHIQSIARERDGRRPKGR